MSQLVQPTDAPERPLSIAPEAQKTAPAAPTPSGPTPYPAWAKFFKKLIDKVGSQGDVAEQLKLSQTQVSRWARGLARPATMETALDVVAALGGNVQDAQVAWNADVARPRGRKPAKKVARKTAQNRPAKKASSSTRKAAPATPVHRPVKPSAISSREVPAKSDVILEGITLAQRSLKEAEAQLDQAVSAARDAGLSWPTIATALTN